MSICLDGRHAKDKTLPSLRIKTLYSATATDISAQTIR